MDVYFRLRPEDSFMDPDISNDLGPSADEPRTSGAVFPLLFIGVAVLGLIYALGGVSLPEVPEIDASASLWLVFLTGLSVGGLSCLAVQGGLLAATIAQREQALQGRETQARDHWMPIVQFLGAKVAAYTLLGAVLGYFGSKIPLSFQGWLMIAAGLFMLGIVGQMYDAHPLLRYLSFRPPKSLQRAMRSRSKQGGAGAPLILGAMTIFIPCGVTLAMEALAISSNDPMRGAQIMAAFTLGTSPLFFVLGFMATRLGRSAYRVFQPLAAATVAVIAFVSIFSGARLIAPERFTFGGEAVVSELKDQFQEQVIQALDTAYEPNRIQIVAGVPTQLKLVTEGTKGCTRAFVIPSLEIERMLGETDEQTVELPAFEAGETIGFTCSMGMYTGVIEVIQ